MSLKLTIRERIRPNREESQSVCYQRCGNNNRSDNNPDLDPSGYLAYLRWEQHALAQEKGDNVPTWSDTKTP